MLADRALPEGLSFDEHDKLGRKSLGRAILSLVRDAADPAVLALDSKWGSGKTFFLHMLKKELEAHGIAVIYLNSFERDYSGDAFATLAGEVLAAYDRHGLADSSERKEFKARAIQVAKSLAVGITKVAIRGATAGAIDLDQTSAAVDAALDETASQVTSALDGVLEDAARHNDRVKAFRRALEELPQRIGETQGEGAGKVVFVIDELDRCRPDFSIGIIEVVKHYFNVPGIFYILSGDFDVTTKSIEHIYGIPGRGREYLGKIIPFYLRLPEVPEESFPSLSASLINRLKGQEASKDKSHLIDPVVELLVAFYRKQVISMRDVDRVLSMWSMVLRLVQPQTLAPPALIVPLLVIRQLDPGMYNEIRRGNLHFDRVVNLLQLRDVGEDSDRSLAWVLEWLRMCSNEDQSDESRRIYDSISNRYYLRSKERILPLVTQNVLDIVWRAE